MLLAITTDDHRTATIADGVNKHKLALHADHVHRGVPRCSRPQTARDANGPAALLLSSALLANPGALLCHPQGPLPYYPSPIAMGDNSYPAPSAADRALRPRLAPFHGIRSTTGR
jgi:hypothetical protein